MEEIEVGEYVRTKYGYIAKITEIDKYIWFNEKVNKESGMAVYELSKLEFKNLVVKHSLNIIDLIEEGDYVNGYYVERVWEQVNYRMAIDLRGSTLGLNDENCIKSIVTKESFKNAEYRVETN